MSVSIHRLFDIKMSMHYSIVRVDWIESACMLERLPEVPKPTPFVRSDGIVDLTIEKKTKLTMVSLNLNRF